MQGIRMLTLIGVCTILSSCLPGENREQGSTSIEVQPLHEGKVRNNVFVPVIATAATALKPLPDQLGSGFAEAKIFADGALRFSIRTNLVPAEKGTYVAWLMGSVSPEPLKVGLLQNPKGDTTYLLQTEEDMQFPANGRTGQEWKLTITYEPLNSSQGNRSTPILEGALAMAALP